VFDIDMTDYDSVRTCCSGADICRRCWSFIAAAVHVLNAAVRDQFGFNHLLWVYSGRRGIHLWISDKEALDLTDDQRKAIVGWLTVIQGGKEMHKKVNVRLPKHDLPPSLRYFTILFFYDSSQYFLRDALSTTLSAVFTETILRDQEVFQSEEGLEALLQTLPESAARALRLQWQGKGGALSEVPKTSEAIWKDILKLMNEGKFVSATYSSTSAWDKSMVNSSHT
jgi:DNA primase small subunit